MKTILITVAIALPLWLTFLLVPFGWFFLIHLPSVVLGTRCVYEMVYLRTHRKKKKYTIPEVRWLIEKAIADVKNGNEKKLHDFLEENEVTDYQWAWW